jgi:hypothetical protein
MSKLTQSSNFNQLNKLEDVTRFVTRFSEDVKNQVNGNLLFGENISCVIVTVNFSTAGNNFLVTHNLGRIATGFICVGGDSAGVVYKGIPGSPSTTTTMYLRASLPVTADIMVF